MKRLFVSLCAFALIAGACSSGPESTPEEVQEDPKAALVEAVEALDGSGLTMSLTLQSTPESLQAMAREDGGELDGDTAQKILASSITVSSNGADNPRDAIGQILVNIGGNDAFEMRIIEETIYLRADVRSILETFGQDPSSLDALAQQSAAGGMDFVGPAIDGEWLALRDYLKTFEQLSGQKIPTTPSKEQQQAAQQLADALKTNATVSAAGEDEAGTHLVVDVPLRETYKEIVAGLSPAANLPVGALPPASEVPNENISFDAWISDGRLSQIEFDFLQLAETFGEDAPEGVDEFALRMTIDEFTGDIPAPEGAIALDLEEILSGFFGGLGGLQSEVSSGSSVVAPGRKNAKTDFPCHYLKGEPRPVLEQFKDECPHLLRR